MPSAKAKTIFVCCSAALNVVLLVAFLAKQTVHTEHRDDQKITTLGKFSILEQLGFKTNEYIVFFEKDRFFWTISSNLISINCGLDPKQAHDGRSLIASNKFSEFHRSFSRSVTRRLKIYSPFAFVRRFPTGTSVLILFFIRRGDSSSVVDQALNLVWRLYSTSTNRWSRCQVAKKSVIQLLYPRTR